MTRVVSGEDESQRKNRYTKLIIYRIRANSVIFTKELLKSRIFNVTSRREHRREEGIKKFLDSVCISLFICLDKLENSK